MSRFSTPKIPDSYDRWKTTTPADYEDIAFYCENCDEEIYVGEEYIETVDGDIHEDCFDEFARKQLDARHKFAEREDYYGEED